MTKKAINTLKGWSIGAAGTVIVGTFVLFTAAKTTEEKEVQDMYINEIIQHDGSDTYQYPSIYDASVITNIPVEVLREAIRTNDTIDGYQFDVKRD